MMSRIRSSRGFSLVELLVVITILAILWTIGFVSLQGYSAQSRDSKRASDIRSLSAAIATKSAEGVALTAMADSTTTDNRLAYVTASVAGATSTDTDYNAGVPNYSVLGLNASNFKDPLGPEYRVGASTRNNGVFQVAAKMEPSGSNTSGVASVTGNYVPRIATTYAATGSLNSIYVTNLPPSSFGLVRKGDVIRISTVGNSASSAVASVASDGRSLVLVSPILIAVTGNRITIILGASGGTNETPGLIATGSGTSIAVTDTSGTNLPY